jgi:hypothetical protein
MVESLVARRAKEFSSEANEPLSLGIDSLATRFKRNRAAAASADIYVPPVLGSLRVWRNLEPDPGAVALGIDEAILADPQVLLAKAEVTPVVIPGCEALWRWLEFVSQGASPEAGERLRI